jgi:2-keto-3-deoxy-6-phosphogluconate aldolase
MSPCATGQIRDSNLQANSLNGIVTVLQAPTSLAAGATFRFLPSLDRPVVERSLGLGLASSPDALTPPEVVTSGNGGARAVTLLSASNLSDPAYLPGPDCRAGDRVDHVSELARRWA